MTDQAELSVRYIHYRVGAADVEDLTQDVFLRAWHSIRRYKPGQKPFLAWLYTIAHNLVVDYYRKKGREQLVPLEDPIIVARGQHDPGMDSFLDLDVVRRMLARSTPESQRILVNRSIDLRPRPQPEGD